MTGDSKAIGNKFGISFTGKWVWNMKNYIDTGFMKLFDPMYLFRDYKTKGCEVKVENNELFDDEKSEELAKVAPLREKVATMTAEEAGKILSCDEEEEEFFERLFIFDRMAKDEEFTAGVVSNFKPPYL